MGNAYGDGAASAGGQRSRSIRGSVAGHVARGRPVSSRAESHQTSLATESGLRGRRLLAAELVGLVYIGIIAELAALTGAYYIMFPELGALSHDVFTRPRGTWARAPLLLAVTPVLTGAVGVIFTRLLVYGFVSVIGTVAGSIAVVMALGSPIAPAISAGLLPLVLGVTSWWYPPGIALGTSLLAVLSIGWRMVLGPEIAPEPPTSEDALEDAIEAPPPPSHYRWLGALLLLVVVATALVKLTGLRFILFPPLVVIAFEMFAHADICPWAKKPLLLPLACLLTAAGGFAVWAVLGVGASAAALAMAWGILVLRVLDLHVPPALAVALLPQVMHTPTLAYPLAVGIGTLLATLCFVGLRNWPDPAAIPRAN